MVNVLQNWDQIGKATIALQRAGLAVHVTPQKNWDQNLLRELTTPMDRGAAIIDLGCGEGHTLQMLRRLGMRNLTGIDLRFDWKLRVRAAAAMYRAGKLRSPYHLIRGDLTQTGLPAHCFDMAVSISTIEHGVNLDAFFAEVSRLLSPGGTLFVTTDYWEEPIIVPDTARAFGLPWRIFDRKSLEELIAIARSSGFRLTCPGEIPSCADRPVTWQGREYTFVALLFSKLPWCEGQRLECTVKD